MGILVFTHRSQNQSAWVHFHFRGCIWFQPTLPCHSKWEIEINAYATFTILEIVAFGQQVSRHFPTNANFQGKPTHNIFDRSVARVIEKFQYISFHFIFGGRKSWMSFQQLKFSNKTHWYVKLSFIRSPFSKENAF